MKFCRLARNDKDVLAIGTRVSHVGHLLLDIAPHAAADRRIELREVANFHSKELSDKTKCRNKSPKWVFQYRYGRSAIEAKLLLLFCQPALGINRGGASLAGSGNGLTIDVVGDVPGGEYAR